MMPLCQEQTGPSLGVFNVYCGNEGKVISRKFFVLVCCG